MRLLYKLFVVMIALTLLVGCATSDRSEYYPGSGEQMRANTIISPELSSDKGRIWFYRGTRKTGAGLRPTVYLDGLIVAWSNYHYVYFVDVSPGNYEVSTSGYKPHRLPITVKKQQHIFVNSNPNFLIEVYQETGKKELGPFISKPE